ncbi:hypothetical protein E1202_11855 [Saccharopolyspora karakumensis]|uniref:Uncharacterized protein n=1 Tax=Saccharopolyspora karakumensis TaxID=2530386 RepID=A0A4R5BV42_9PSEU|nr:hypothetical protein [Saccharopolyspora karakumensis]TDD89200.1 hypothetical protein E1202_11855 [Saccharopolyspora karakumensis]
MHWSSDIHYRHLAQQPPARSQKTRPDEQKTIFWSASRGLHGPALVLITNAAHPASGYDWATNVDRQVKSAELLTYGDHFGDTLAGQWF